MLMTTSLRLWLNLFARGGAIRTRPRQFVGAYGADPCLPCWRGECARCTGVDGDAGNTPCLCSCHPRAFRNRARRPTMFKPVAPGHYPGTSTPYRPAFRIQRRGYR